MTRDEILESEHPTLGICGWEWIEFEDIRESGEYNMLDPRARLDADMNDDNWFIIIENYQELYNFFTA